jgi:hypothetical protein
LALRGTLDVVSVADVLRLVAVTAKTGRLQLESDRVRGVVWLRDGHVTAVTEAESPADMKVADMPVAETLFWFGLDADGWLSFEVDDEAPELASALRVEDLLVDLDLIEGEWDALQLVVPSLDHRIGLVTRLDRPRVTIDAAVWPAILASAYRPTVRDHAAQFGLGHIDALRSARDLVETGLFEVLPPRDLAGGSVGLLDGDEPEVAAGVVGSRVPAHR